MKAVRLHARGGPESLVFEDAPKPSPGAGEVLVRVFAAAVTPTELLWVPTWTTQTGEPRPLPIIPGHEFAGNVAALGVGVTGVELGSAVYGMNEWSGNGAQAEYCLAPVTAITKKPSSVDYVQAAAMPISVLTAWQGLIERGRLTRGEHVLIHGAAGAVGGFAVQLACWRGARVTATASAANVEYVRGLGALEVIDYRARPFEDTVHDVDLVFDTVGGDTLKRSWNILKPGGRAITIATSEEGTQDERTREAFFIVEPNRMQLEEMARLIDAGEIRVSVGAEFQLPNALEAYRYKPLHGKVVLRVGSTS
jgi:NADPH:quinone reductase-like Zn-dependent oxidoreductase